MQARIYQPAKTAMQSGKAKTGVWILEFVPQSAKTVDPLMGYTSVSGTMNQVRLQFPDQEAAVTYARNKGLAYSIEQAHAPKRRQVAYADNFRFDRRQPWTH